MTHRVSVVIVEVHFAEMAEHCCLAIKSYYTPCKCCLSIFTKIKLLIINRDSSNSVFCRYFTSIKYNFCLYNKCNSNNVFYRSIRWAENSFTSLRKTLYFRYSFNTSVVNNQLYAVMFTADHCVCLSYRERYLGQICQSSEAKIWNPACRASVLWLSTLF